MNFRDALQTAKEKAHSMGVPYWISQRTMTRWTVSDFRPLVKLGVKVYKAYPSAIKSGMVEDNQGRFCCP